jgi:hypothetical protein
LGNPIEYRQWRAGKNVRASAGQVIGSRSCSQFRRKFTVSWHRCCCIGIARRAAALALDTPEDYFQRNPANQTYGGAAIHS